MPPKKKVKVCANPEIEQWLSELCEAESRNEGSKIIYTYKKALAGVRLYPLPINSGDEAKLLKCFGPKLCSKLDKKLAEWRVAGTISAIPDPVSSAASTSALMSQAAVSVSATSTVPSSKTGRVYIPAYRSGSFAILLALYARYKQAPEAIQGVKKDELIELAQPLSENSFTVAENQSRQNQSYTCWSNMGTLISKGLVLRAGMPHRFTITDAGCLCVENMLHGVAVEEYIAKVLKRGEPQPMSQESDTCEETQSSDQPLREVPTVNGDNNCTITGTVPEAEVELFTVERDAFDIILLVDNQEYYGKGQKGITAHLVNNQVQLEVRKLNAADYAWVARPHDSSRCELLLDCLVERKRMDDLSQSICDGRYLEQKHRLQNCGVSRIIYLVEEYGSRDSHTVSGEALQQALMNTLVCDNIQLKQVENAKSCADYLTMMTRLLKTFYAGARLHAVKRPDMSRPAELVPLPNEENGRTTSLLLFTDFQAAALKTPAMTVEHAFGRQLLCIRGVTLEKAEAILKIYPTPRLLMEAVASTPDENFLATVVVGNYGKRRLGPALSKTIYNSYRGLTV